MQLEREHGAPVIKVAVYAVPQGYIAYSEECSHLDVILGDTVADALANFVYSYETDETRE